MKQHRIPTDYRMVNKAGSGEIWLYGTVGLDWFGDGVSPKQFANDLRALGNVSQIDFRINSDGGVVDDARAMYSLLVDHPANVTVYIDGVAASAASFLAMAGNEIVIAEGGFIMIHNARMIFAGDENAFLKAAERLRKANATMINTYAARTKNKEDKLKAWMDAETWFDGKEAVAAGFADRIAPDMRAVASVRDPSQFVNLPEALRPNRAAAMKLIQNSRK